MSRHNGTKPGKKKKVKWEPAALMVIVLALGMWIAFGPASRPHFDKRPNAVWQELRLGNTRGIVEAAIPPGGTEYTFRRLTRDEPPSREYTRAEAEEIWGKRNVEQIVAPRTNGVFRYLNITSWAGVVWLGIGLCGQIAFSGRMILQWITSEKRRQSIITESFWWFSLFGSVTLFSYFVWRQDPVAMLGQASGVVIYARNLRLIYKQKRRTARAAAAVQTPGAASIPQEPTTAPTVAGAAR
jgi:lipid-A-disaccharide synthase-like uncharacterized protein